MHVDVLIVRDDADIQDYQRPGALKLMTADDTFTRVNAK